VASAIVDAVYGNQQADALYRSFLFVPALYRYLSADGWSLSGKEVTSKDCIQAGTVATGIERYLDILPLLGFCHVLGYP